MAAQVESQACWRDPDGVTDRLTDALITLIEIVREGHDNTGGTDHQLVIDEFTRGALRAYRDED